MRKMLQKNKWNRTTSGSNNFVNCAQKKIVEVYAPLSNQKLKSSFQKEIPDGVAVLPPNKLAYHRYNCNHNKPSGS